MTKNNNGNYILIVSFFRCQRKNGMMSNSNKHLFISIALAFGAMLSKEHGITVLGINFVWDVFLHRHFFLRYVIYIYKQSPIYFLNTLLRSCTFRRKTSFPLVFLAPLSSNN